MNNARDHNRDSDHANDNGEHERPGDKQVASAPAGGALTSLAALQAALANVNTAAIIGRSGLPMLLFKREGSGTWMFGQKKTIPEPGSRWAVNPMTFKYGFICFNDNKVLGEHLVSVSQPKPLITDMQDVGFPWQEEWAVNLKCLDGADAGVEVTFKATTRGQIQAVVLLVDLVRDRLNSAQHDGKIAPIVVPFLPGATDLPGAHGTAARSCPVHGADRIRRAEGSLPAAPRRGAQPRRRGQRYSHGAA